MMKKLIIYIVGLLLVACSSDDNQEDAYVAIDEPYNLEIPTYFPELEYTFKNNPLTKNGVKLGKKLFYEGRLSSNNMVSCAFCHEQAHAFTHHGHSLSHGVDDLVGTRNTSAIQNLAFQDEYFFDGAASNLEMVAIVPIHNPVEMNETLPSIISKLEAIPEYQQLFAAAFEDKKINSTNLMKALAQFMTIVVSKDSKYDEMMRGETQFTPQEEQGFALFESKCASCHATSIFTDNSFRNNGLPVNPRLNDKGRAEVSGSEADLYKFKVPSLRNVELTAPYMHDGRFGTLESVLQHYTSNVEDYPNLDENLRTEHGTGIDLSKEQQEALISFLKTLTDYDFITNDEFYERT
jgi:cytochrome c peroxidase